MTDPIAGHLNYAGNKIDIVGKVIGAYDPFRAVFAEYDPVTDTTRVAFVNAAPEARRSDAVTRFRRRS